MNFDEELLRANGVGAYEYVDTTQLPQLWLSYLADPSVGTSGCIHCHNTCPQLHPRYLLKAGANFSVR